MATYKLTYFDAKGKAEVSRLLFAKAGVEYEDKRVDQEEFKDLKDKTPFGQLPMLEVDGQVMSQSFVIMRFLGKRFGMYGKTEFDEARIDEVAMGMEDVVQPCFNIVKENDETKQAELKKKYEEETLPNFLKFFERMLVQNNGGNGFFVGNTMTAADVCFAYCITFLSFANVTIDWSQFPKLKDLKQRVEEDEKIAAWIMKRPVTKL